MISVRPTEQPYGELRASVGNFGAYHVEGAFSGQIANGLTGMPIGMHLPTAGPMRTAVPTGNARDSISFLIVTAKRRSKFAKIHP